MLITQPQGHIFERVLRAKDGKLVRVTFVVAEVAGELRARVLSVAPYQDEAATAALKAAAPLALPGYVPTTAIKPVRKSGFSYKSVLSPLQNLSFFVSQPTRAPSIA